MEDITSAAQNFQVPLYEANQIRSQKDNHYHFNQSIKICIAPLQDPYSEALPSQAKTNSLERVEELRTGTVWRCLRPIGSAFQVVGPTTESHLYYALSNDRVLIDDNDNSSIVS